MSPTASTPAPTVPHSPAFRHGNVVRGAQAEAAGGCLNAISRTSNDERDEIDAYDVGVAGYVLKSGKLHTGDRAD
ncbi:MAG TPA: hypothetical protein VF322_03435 [Gammaproteobacteria bacterium]